MGFKAGKGRKTRLWVSRLGRGGRKGSGFQGWEWEVDEDAVPDRRRRPVARESTPYAAAKLTLQVTSQRLIHCVWNTF